MTDLWRIRSSAHTSLHTGVAKLAASMTASAHRGQAELREPYTDADAHAALRMVTQNSLPMQRYCNRATTSCKVYATVTSLDNEVLDGSTKAQETKSEQPARGTAIERFAIAPTARRSAAAVHQEANNGATDTDSRAQHTIERTSSKLLSLQKRRKRIKIACDRTVRLAPRWYTSSQGDKGDGLI